MFHPATTRILQRRTFSTSGIAPEQAADCLFVSAWKRIMPNLDPPKTPLAFFYPRPSNNASPTSTPLKLTVNLFSPFDSVMSQKEVDMITIPATSGQMGILPGHVPSVSELKPGVLLIQEGNEVTRYFISSGFAFVHSNCIADIFAREAVPIEQVDPASVQKQLAEFTQKLLIASTDLEKAEAQVGVDVLTALNSSLCG